jgi:hypothetical protein
LKRSACSTMTGCGVFNRTSSGRFLSAATVHFQCRSTRNALEHEAGNEMPAAIAV